MNLRTGLRSVLINKVGAGTRVYFAKLPQNPTYPAVTLEQISGDPGNTVNSVPGLSWARIRANSWGRTYEEADTVAHAVEAELNGQKFNLEGVRIGSIVADGIRDFYEPEVEAYYMSEDFRIFYEEASGNGD
jgi:hypothetical protein